MTILPMLKKMIQGEGKLFAQKFKLQVDNDAICEFIDLPEAEDGSLVSFEKVSGKVDEWYSVNINNDGVFIKYADIEGAYRAYTTLKQLIRENALGELCFVEIEDYPSIKNRGYMFSISKIPHKDYLKWLIDLISDMKYNQLQLYMDHSDVYQYKNFPSYWHRDAFSKEEIEEIDEYCRKHFIKLVPTTNGFGHMESWIAKDEFKHLGITRDDGAPSRTVNPLMEESLELVDKIYDGFLDAFSADMVNIGMDEPFELGMGETKEACEKEGQGKIYTDHVIKICKLASKKYGKTPMLWDDIIFKYPEQLKRLPKDCIVLDWGYETEHYFDRYCNTLSSHGLRFYVCPGSSTWRTYTGRSVNMMFNIVAAAKSAAFYNAEGFLMTEWSDPGHMHTPTITYLPLILAGAMSWNSGSNDDIEACMERREVMARCYEYLDKNIFKAEGNISLADIIYRMGNYYFLENSVNCNATELSCCFTRPEVITEEMKPGFRRVIEYMKGIRKELDAVKADEICLREAKLNCDMVIFTAELVLGKRDKVEADRIEKEKAYLYKCRFKEKGIEIFSNMLKTFFG